MPGKLSTSNDPPRATRRHRLLGARVSLQTLLAAVAVMCLVGGHYANRFHQQRQVVGMVNRHGGQIGYRAVASRGPVLNWLDRLRWRDIEEVTLFFAPIEDQSLSVLRSCRNLKRLNLDYTSVGDRALEHVAHISSLVWLDLKQTQVTDAGMKWIVRLPQLKSLRLDGTSLGDNGLEQLEAAPSLEFLSLRDTQVTAAGRARFQRAQPDCRLAFDARPETSSAVGVNPQIPRLPAQE